MKKTIFILLSFLFVVSASAQEETKSIAIGDQLTILKPTSNAYHYVNFPKKNILVKQGALPNYQSVYGTAVIVDKIAHTDKGTKLTLRKKDMGRFFGTFPTVTAYYESAVAQGELGR